MSSIRKRIITFLLMAIFVINISSAFYIYRHTQHEIEEIFNAEQAQVARTILSIVNNVAPLANSKTLVTQVPKIAENSLENILGHHYERKIAFQVWSASGDLLLMSENAPSSAFAKASQGYSEYHSDGETWHVFALHSVKNDTWVYTAQNIEAREELIRLITRDQLLSVFLVNILVILVVVLGVIKGVKPISIFSRELAKRDGLNLSSITIETSQELKPIQEGVNRLLERIEKTLAQERSFNADLSHELRTPLAAIKVHAQTIDLTDKLSSEGRRSLNSMIASVGVMSQTIEQLLLLNSIEHQSLSMLEERIDVYDLCKQTIVLLPNQINTKNNIELEGDSTIVKGNAVLLAALVRNLIENASKYSEPDTPIRVRATKQNDCAIIEVADRGPGMNAEQKSNATKRYFRVSDRQSYGSGLGLSIVNKIVALHLGTLEFLDQESGPGLIVKVLLPLEDN